MNGKHLILFLCAFVLATLNGYSQLQLINQRQLTLLEKARRPGDPWPRGDGHVLIGEPGSPVSQKGYHEPGGSFTPSPGSFGISLWVVGSDGKRVVTSDDIALEKIQERYVHLGDARIPSVESMTPYYTSTWTNTAPGQWKLDVQNVNDGQYIEVVVRSVGPAGGPLEFVAWDKSRLLLDRRWILTPAAKPELVVAGDESKGELSNVKSGAESIRSESGWGFARLRMNGSFSLTLKNTLPQFASMLSYERTTPRFTFQLPDKNFEQSLNAQVSTLMMGYIGRQTGPGEPINYPLAWERDGAYSLMAMAKSGQLQTARELSTYFAENDFFGGFGAEGDAPGSAINALTEVAFLLNDPQYDQWLWPHIERKLALIDEMIQARENLYKSFIGPLAPHITNDIRRRELIARPFENGLIVGTMDNHFPVLYINALSYRAFIQASRLATKLNKPAIAASCVTKANTIRPAWINAFGQPKYDNERNFMISVWPSWIINKDFKPFVEKITQQRKELWSEGVPKARPLWTYFTVSEAHQWLFLDRIDKTWETLHYFWNNQCAPGLYTYWEGEGEENTFRQWENYRGWLNPKYVTPHYWTASEMTHLQLDMLVYIDESKQDYEIVVGAGVPSEWLSGEMSVKNFSTKAGMVTWQYKDHKLTIILTGVSKKIKVRAGSSFRAANTTVNVNYK